MQLLTWLHYLQAVNQVMFCYIHVGQIKLLALLTGVPTTFCSFTFLHLSLKSSINTPKSPTSLENYFRFQWSLIWLLWKPILYSTGVGQSQDDFWWKLSGLHILVWPTLVWSIKQNSIISNVYNNYVQFWYRLNLQG